MRVGDDRLMERVQRLLPEGEKVLWAVRSKGAGWRDLPAACGPLVLVAAGWHLGILATWPFLFGFLVYFLLRMTVGLWFYTYAGTDARVVILHDFPPRSWTWIAYDRMDADGLRRHEGVIKLRASFRPKGSGLWSSLLSHQSMMRSWIAPVEDVETIRRSILERLPAQAGSNEKAA